MRSYRVSVSSDGISWSNATREGNLTMEANWRSDPGVVAAYPVETMFDVPIVGRYVRIYPVDYNGHPGMRSAVLVCDSTGLSPPFPRQG